MLEVRVRKRQGAFLLDAAFTTAPSGVTALFGPSGTGKTTLIGTIAGLRRPDAGLIRLGDRILFDADRGIDLPPEKRRIGYVFQDGRLFPHLSVRANLVYGMGTAADATARELTFDGVVELLGIGHLLERRPARLSGGEKQRVAMGRALLTRPSLLLMDEPLASLDQARKAEVLPFIARLSEHLSIPILYVSHSVNEILNLADDMVILRDGHVAARGPIEEVMSRSDVHDVTGLSDYGVVIPTRVEGYEEGVTLLRFPGGILKVPYMVPQEARKVRVRVPAAHVVLALARPRGLSIRNVFEGVVESILDDDGFLVNVRVNVGWPLVARITPAALRDMDIAPGRRVFALVKSVAISGGRGRLGDG